MKNKTTIKLLCFIFAILFLVLAIISIRITYARYITSLTATSTVEMGSWLIYVNNQNIVQNSDLSSVITPVFNTDSEYIAEGKISPTSTGYVEIEIDYSEVTVPFTYDISFAADESTPLPDFKLTSYSVDGGGLINVDASATTITTTVSPDETDRTKIYKLNFGWVDGAGENFNDIQDTAFSRNFDNIGLRFDIEFTQLQPNT